MRILVTGATGFIGSHLMDKLSGLGHKVIGMGRTERHVATHATYHYVDLRDFEKASKIIRDFKPEIVFHLAANSIESSGEHSPIDMTTNNYNTFFTTLAASIQGGSLKKFIFTSSAAVYGNIRTPYMENQNPQPNDLYAIAKYANELSLLVMARTYGFSYVILRLHNVTGPRQDPTDPRRNVVTMFMQLLRLGKKPKIFGDGTSQRCYTYVDDVVAALHQSLDVNNVICNVGSDTSTTIQNLYNVIVAVSGISIEPDYEPGRDNEVELNTVDHVVSKQIYNIQSTPFADVIRKTWEWVNKQPLNNFKSFIKEIDL